MKRNIISYINEFGNKTFEERSFTEVDGLILSEFVYLELDKLVPGIGHDQEGISIKNLKRHSEFEQLFGNKLYGKKYRSFYKNLYESKRFCDIKINYFVNEIDEINEMQFAAVTFCVDNQFTYIAYRGTDDTMIGWKEDFNLACIQPIPSHIKGVSYLEKVASKQKGILKVGGHSKGGNTAIYAAMYCEAGVQERIQAIYSYDGPGIREELVHKEQYENIAKKIYKYVPEDSLVGMLLENTIYCQPVRCYGSGVIQHNPLNWKVKGCSFDYRETIHNFSHHRNTILNKWIHARSNLQLQTIINRIFVAIYATGQTTVGGFLKKFPKNLVVFIVVFLYKWK